MADNMIFRVEELENLQGSALQQEAQKIKQRFDQKKGMYHQLRNNPFMVLSWTDVNDKIIEFDEKHFNPWNKQWNNIHRQSNIQSVIDFFNQGLVFYDEMDRFVVRSE